MAPPVHRGRELKAKDVDAEHPALAVLPVLNRDYAMTFGQSWLFHRSKAGVR